MFATAILWYVSTMSALTDSDTGATVTGGSGAGGTPDVPTVSIAASVSVDLVAYVSLASLLGCTPFP